jgi:hypothetical protein
MLPVVPARVVDSAPLPVKPTWIVTNAVCAAHGLQPYDCEFSTTFYAKSYHRFK